MAEILMMNSTHSMQDKRKEPRFPVTIPVTCRDPISNNTVYAQIHDISDSGLGVLVTKCLPIGTLLDLKLSMIDSSEQLLARGRVVWAEILNYNKYRMGIKLEDQKLRAIELVLRTASSQIV